MRYRPRFGTKQRDALYSREATAAHKAGRGRYPICPHCDLPVEPGQPWDEVHVGAPKCFGGKDTGVGHRECNQRDNNENVTPAAAKAERVRKFYLGITGPGLGRCPMDGGRRSSVTRTMTHGVRPRLTQAQKLAATLARRSFTAADIEPQAQEGCV